MLLRLAFLAWLVGLAAAGPLSWDSSKCSQKCDGGIKYQYSEQKSYIYSFESENVLEADGASDLLTFLKATVQLTAVSKCEMVLQMSDVVTRHGGGAEQPAPELAGHPLPFAWDDGRVAHLCPHPDEPADAANMKRAVLSALQNTMRSFEAPASFQREDDILGSCDTEYVVSSKRNDRFVFLKTKNIQTCTNHIKGQTLLLASLYESSSAVQHLPLLSGRSLSCEQTVRAGLLEEAACEEAASFRPLRTFGYAVEAKGRLALALRATREAAAVRYTTKEKESLTYKYEPKLHQAANLESEAENVLKQICENSEGLINKEVSNSVHKLVYLIRGLNVESLEKIYNSLKNKQLCSSGKTLSLFLDALRSASSGGAIGLLVRLVQRGDYPLPSALAWLTLLPFASHLEEASVAAALPLLEKGTARKQALLGVSAMAFKYCSTRKDCESVKAIRDLSAKLKGHLGEKCHTTNKEEETNVVSALKAFGNLGYIGSSGADAVLECVASPANPLAVRVAALDAFRRSPCTEEVVGKLLEIYKSRTEEDEVRIASFISLSKCLSPEILLQILKSYSTETSNQVKVFTWSYLRNLQSSSDRMQTAFEELLRFHSFEAPGSVDATKFSRNFRASLLSEWANVGGGVEANLLHSKASFLPRSASLGWRARAFGNELDLLQVGARAEDLEHGLEQLFGRHGLLPNLELRDLLALVPRNERRKRAAESYQPKLDALGDRLAYSRGRTPHGSAYFRILGHELGWINIHKDMMQRYAELDFENILKNMASAKPIDVAKNLLFLDLSILFPSVTGRAYKLAGNASVTVAMKLDGKVDLVKSQFPIPRINIEGVVQPRKTI